MEPFICVPFFLFFFVWNIYLGVHNVPSLFFPEIHFGSLLRKYFLGAGKSIFLEADAIPVTNFHSYKWLSIETHFKWLSNGGTPPHPPLETDL